MKFKRQKTIYERKSAFQKRQNTLGKAYANRNKCGQFTDSRQSRNFADDERRQEILDANESISGSAHILTHKGIPIKDLKRNAPVIRDDEKDIVDADTVNELHFGGGLFSAQRSVEKPISFKDKMHDLIQRSKQKKAGHQLHQEEVHDNVQKADENWLNTMEKIVSEFDRQPSKLKRRLQEKSYQRNRESIMEMNTVVNYLQSSGVTSSGGNALTSEKDQQANARSMGRLNQYLDNKNELSNEENDESSFADPREEEVRSVKSDEKRTQPFQEVIHCLDVLINLNDEKRLLAISELCRNLQQPIRRFGRLVGGLLISNLLSKATTLRGNSSPELYRFLVNALSLAVPSSQRPKDFFLPLSITPSFIEVTEKVTEKFDVNEEESVMAMESFMDKNSSVSNTLSLHCLVLLLCLVEREIRASKKRGRSAPEVLGPFSDRMRSLPVQLYPPNLKNKVDEMIRLIDGTVKSEEVRPVMQWTEPRHKEIEMIEPIFGDELYARKRAGKRGPLTKDEKTRILKKKVKDERKSAMRELRRDGEFLQAVKRKDTAEKDAERKKKVAKIIGDLATQEGDFRKLNKRH